MSNKNISEKNKYFSFNFIFLGILLFSVGVLLGFYFDKTDSMEKQLSTDPKELRLGGNGFTNPLLECELGAEIISSRKEDFTPDLVKFIDAIKKSKHISDVSVYYRDLNNGPIVGYNQSNTYAPASLLKIPVLISYLKWSEEDKSILDEKILFSKPVDVGYIQQYAPSIPLVVGQTYTTKELLETMIKYSDNQALVLLFKRIPQRYQEELYTLLGVDKKLITSATTELTIRQYSIFFRVLFNASFLSRTNSEYALSLLSQTSFDDGLREGVPLNIPISHKFGERETSDGMQQFHDCGIVYYPNHPYLICVMTRGDNVSNLIDTISRVSDFVYKKIDDQYGK